MLLENSAWGSEGSMVTFCWLKAVNLFSLMANLSLDQLIDFRAFCFHFKSVFMPSFM